MSTELRVGVRLTDGSLEYPEPMTISHIEIPVEETPKLRVSYRTQEGQQVFITTEPDHEATRKMLVDGAQNLGVQVLNLHED